MDSEQIKNLAQLRMAVGYLGEQAETRWWSSEFCGPGGKAFLAPVFPRTHVLAQLQGVTSAAALVHDERIGVGEVFHLFRLPEDLEQSLHAVDPGEQLGPLAEVKVSVESARRFLSDYAGDMLTDAVGPVRIGQLSSMREASAWRNVAACYCAAFQQQRETFPFFSDSK